VLAASSALMSCCCREGPAQVAPAAESRTSVVAEAPGDAAIREALRTKRVRSLDWGEEVTIPQAASYLRTITGLNFHVTPRAQVEAEDVRVPFQVEDVSVLDVLDVMTEMNGLAWEVYDGLVRIGLKDEIGGPLRLRFYDVNDLVDEPGPGVAVEPAPPSPRGEALVRAVRAQIDPETWAEGRGEVEQRKGVLIVRASSSTHAKIEAYLDALRRAGG
jgi:hypothetical protein